MTPRPYQSEAIDALNKALRERKDNPCVVLPTGAGKSIVIAWTIQGWLAKAPWLRVVVLAHRQELIEQNAAELEGLNCVPCVGVYAAGLDSRDTQTPVTYAVIDSVYQRAQEFGRIDVIIVDEAHRIPPKGEGKYRTFIADALDANPNCRVVGFTATPFRMGCGQICHPQHVLNHVCYDASVSDLIDDGYLCPLRAKVSENTPDLSAVKVASTGDYVVKDLANAADAVTDLAVNETCRIINAEGRRCVMAFCVNREHAEHVQHAFSRSGVDARLVTGVSKKEVRRQTVEDFRAGKFRVLVNINVYTEGFNVKQVDCVAVYRPTKSAGMWCQMVGRGLRLHPAKTDCLVLDYGNNIDTHGPIDAIGKEAVRMVTCGSCREAFSRALGSCPQCQWQIPKVMIQQIEREERERALHEAKAAQAAILTKQEEVLFPDACMVSRHCKEGMPDSIRVDYRCGLEMVSEWVCLDHDGFAGKKARDWWEKRFGWKAAKSANVDDALADLFTGDNILNRTLSLVVSRNGKRTNVQRHNLRGWNSDPTRGR